MDKESDSLLTLQLLLGSGLLNSLRLVTRGDYHFSPVSAGGVGYNETRVFLLLLSYPLNSPPLSHPAGQKGRKRRYYSKKYKNKKKPSQAPGRYMETIHLWPCAGWLGWLAVMYRRVHSSHTADLLPTNGGPNVSSCCCIGQSQVHMVRMSLFTLPLLNLLSCFFYPIFFDFFREEGAHY